MKEQSTGSDASKSCEEIVFSMNTRKIDIHVAVATHFEKLTLKSSFLRV